MGVDLQSALRVVCWDNYGLFLKINRVTYFMVCLGHEMAIFARMCCAIEYDKTEG